MSERKVRVGRCGEILIWALCDDDSIWVEITGPRGGNAWQTAPHRARSLAQELVKAADAAEALDRESAAAEGLER
jgi:hypothetical protein